LGGLLIALATMSGAAGQTPPDPSPRPDVTLVDQASKSRLSQALDPGGPASERAVVLAAIAAEPVAPAWLGGPLARLLAEGSVDDRPVVAAALGSVRTRESFRALLNAAIRADSPRLTDAATGAMARLTGRSDIGGDLAGWERLLGQVQWLPEAEWRLTLAEWLARGADQTIRDRDAAMSRLSDLYTERLASAPDASAREKTLRELLTDPTPAMQRLGLSLSLRELANARPLNPGVADAAAALLSSPHPETRRLTAQLLATLSPASTDAAVLDALSVETDPQAASDLLVAASRRPRAALAASALRWMSGPEPARSGALGCLLALEESGLLTDRATRDQVAGVVRASRSDELSVASVRLLLALGDASDAQRVARMLERAADPARAVAAEAMSRHAPSLDALVSAASADPALAPIAIAGLIRHRATPDGLAAALALAGDNTELVRQPALKLAADLPATDLVRLASGVRDAALRQDLLARLPGASPQPGLDEGLLLLARTRLELRRPVAALAALDAARNDAPGVADLRRVVLIRLGRLDAPELARASTETWIAGLEASLDQVHAPQVIAAIDARAAMAGADLPPDLRDRFNAARAVVSAFVGPAARPDEP
jgi:hypothetical protein